jgi:hypothetical protein
MIDYLQHDWIFTRGPLSVAPPRPPPLAAPLCNLHQLQDRHNVAKEPTEGACLQNQE